MRPIGGLGVRRIMKAGRHTDLIGTMCRPALSMSGLFPAMSYLAGAAAEIPSLSITFLVTSSLMASLMNTPADCEAVLSMM